jgi:hypothetical protein
LECAADYSILVQKAGLERKIKETLLLDVKAHEKVAMGLG